MSFKMKIYLAGGMKSNWQSNVKSKFANNFIFFNPQDHKLEKPKDFTCWDLHFVNQADIVFAYLEKDNPSGYGLTLEIGYAKALNKTIILVDERSKVDRSFSNYFNIVRESANVVFEDFESGLRYLDRFSVYSI